MSRTRCFLLEPTERVRQKLRRYSNCDHWDAEQKKTVYDNPCPINNGFYHNAETPIEDALAIRNEEGYITNGSRSEDDGWPRDDPRWPTQCACGYQFTEHDAYQLFCELIYRRADTGEEMTLRDAAPGAMWYAPWLDQFHHPQDEHNLVVKLPDKTDWCVDSQASNCTMADDAKQERHHCWTRQGAPPDVDVSKNYGPSCQAGAGSIQSASWHGFLRAGWLEE